MLCFLPQRRFCNAVKPLQPRERPKRSVNTQKVWLPIRSWWPRKCFPISFAPFDMQGISGSTLCRKSFKDELLMLHPMMRVCQLLPFRPQLRPWKLGASKALGTIVLPVLLCNPGISRKLLFEVLWSQFSVLARIAKRRAPRSFGCPSRTRCLTLCKGSIKQSLRLCALWMWIVGPLGKQISVTISTAPWSGLPGVPMMWRTRSVAWSDAAAKEPRRPPGLALACCCVHRFLSYETSVFLQTRQIWNPVRPLPSSWTLMAAATTTSCKDIASSSPNTPKPMRRGASGRCNSLRSWVWSAPCGLTSTGTFVSVRQPLAWPMCGGRGQVAAARARWSWMRKRPKPKRAKMLPGAPAWKEAFLPRPLGRLPTTQAMMNSPTSSLISQSGLTLAGRRGRCKERPCGKPLKERLGHLNFGRSAMLLHWSCKLNAAFQWPFSLGLPSNGLRLTTDGYCSRWSS